MRHIFVKILLLGLGTAFFTALMLSLFLTTLFSHYFYQKYEIALCDALQEAESLTVKYLEGEVAVNSYRRGMQLIDRLQGTHFCVLDTHGKTVLETAPAIDTAPSQQVLKNLVREVRKDGILNEVIADPKERSLDILIAATAVPGATVVGFFPVADIKEPIRESVQLVWLAALGAFVVAVILTFFVSRHFTRPLINMSQVALRMGHGDFSARIQLDRKDEIGQLAQALNFMASQLDTLERNRQDFLSNVSHELRTPLTSIRGFIQGILDDTIPSENRLSYLARVFAETGRLSQIIDDLLALAQLRSGRFQFNWKDIDPKGVLEEVIEMLTPLAAEKGVTLNFTGGSESRTLTADRLRLSQVFTNVIDNAIKFSPARGEVEINAGWEADSFKISVADEGPGIPQEELPHVFERFYMGSSSSEYEHQGTGLGLAISKLLVEEHGGTITVRNRSSGGCEFVIFLPAERTFKS